MAAAELAALLPGLRATIVFSRLGLPADTADEWLGWPAPSGSPVFLPHVVPFSHPLWALFSSGTTTP